jgi:RimJ/RimL family protein N-acetyltransferase
MVYAPSTGHPVAMLVIEGDGIELRPLQISDAAAHKAGEDLEQLDAFEFPGPAPLENVTAAIREWERSWAEDGPVRDFGIWATATSELIGNVEVRVTAPHRVSLSYLVFPEWRRRGVATQAARLALRYAAEQLDAAYATISVLETNAASRAVASSLGAEITDWATSEAGRRQVVFTLRL